MATQPSTHPEPTRDNESKASTIAEPSFNDDDAKTEKNSSEKLEDGGKSVDDTEYPTGLKFACIMSSAFMCMFLTSLDRMIITTAIPKITDEFHSVTDIGWYGSAYLLTQCASQLLFGKLYTFFSVKGTFLTSLFLFEVGSAICGAAPNSVSFIIGRAIAGLGAAGILSGVVVIIVHAVPLRKRPTYQGLFGAIFGVSSVVGPLLGGVFTSKVTWRWCFYINLPLGGLAGSIIFLILTIPDRDATKLDLKSKLAQLDFFGTALLIPGSVSLILAMEWGGSTYAWNNWRIILLLVLAAVLLAGFALVQVFMPKTATLPSRIFKQRSILAGVYATICNGSQLMIFSYYLPIWFQAIKGVSAVESGIRLLPLMLSMVVATLMTGALVRRIGYYTPFMIGGICLMAVGAGLIYTFEVNTDSGKWIGYQVLYGFGLGLSTQAPNLAAQTVLPKKDVPVGISLMFFGQLIGGAIFLAVAQNILNTQLVERLSSVPGLDAQKILDNGVTSLTDLPAAIKTTALIAYNEAIRHVFLVGLVLVCLAIFGALALEWRSVRQPENNKSDSKA
ncbi:hypothetical protein HER10_EVM0004820 [Colletotrichum scovillei]|uniref:MFS aflatoxin efflux pump n=1 Tax=Colletotrichum scovillei TaxID=1209932 RepID=A0A9P7UBA6_9PEZI|nr:uncharacterized protein HER10_EVM0004820 [Colletotrichum scovillei]KAF4785297.1 hypothetical protein HER10_EVM0004820 [Colletotrichum scovillei]KAG7048086.1 MFS aflatoxin efflux pump [Colletotrichum scovillei]KAG7065252.1 MFS aflatoxin efflux pump [Colletotrichum scovillei]KAG7067854.1 MFS aflatoxin efflux pump [Colletotrichum scovillei]